MIMHVEGFLMRCICIGQNDMQSNQINNNRLILLILIYRVTIHKTLDLPCT